MGFFTQGEIIKSASKVIDVYQLEPECGKCKLQSTCMNPKIKFTGEGRKGILIISDYPSEEEDLYGASLMGDPGKLLGDELKVHKISLNKDCWKMNAVSCFINPKISVYTSKGYKYISDVSVGDLVLTHKGRFRRVLSRIHDLPKNIRMNKEKLVRIKTKFKSYTVTQDHKFYNGKKWISAINLKTNDNISVLGETCIICGKIYNKNPRVYDGTMSTCCQKCYNKATSMFMKAQYKNGVRDKKTITKEANKKMKQLVQEGVFCSEDKRTKESKTSCYEKNAQSRERINSLYTGIIVGSGEFVLGNWLIKEEINFIHQYSIGVLNFDYFIKDHNLLVEIENPKSFYHGKKAKKIRYDERTKIAIKNGHDIVFISSENPIEELKRILKNHSGEYVFTTTKIEHIEIYTQKRQEYLYCLEVEEDHSFIAGGIVSHNCRPPNGRIPTHKEIKCCYPHVEKAIRTLKPKLIITLGSLANTSLFGEDFSNREVARWRAYEIPDQKFGCFIVPLYHPKLIVDKEKDKNLKCTFVKDMKRVSHCLKRTYEAFNDYEQYVTILTDFKAVKSLLKRILNKKPTIAFDYETTGLKPYREGHKLSTIGIAVSTEKAYAFPFNYKSFWTNVEFETIKLLWKRILRDNDIKKVVQNWKFEDSWSKVHVGTRATRWHWDTMMAEHILDNRRASTGLKFQAFVNYGVRPYDNVIAPFLKSKNEEFNTIEKAPFRELLIYNGLDCIFTMMRYKDQSMVLPRLKNRFKAYKLFMRGLHTMGTIQNNGIPIDMEYYEQSEKDLNIKMKGLNKSLIEGREARKFKETYNREINIASNADLGKLFYEVLGKSPVLTANGNYKTDKPTLETLNLPFVDKLIEIKKLEKCKGTYLAQFIREEVNGIIHPFFDLHIPISYRSSSSAPNFQNIPNRDAIIKALIRKGIVPSKNCRLAEQDFSGAEIVTSACVTGDTKIETIEGSKSIKQIIKRIKTENVFVYGYDLIEKRIKIAQVTEGGITGEKQEVWKVTLDNGKCIKATKEHNFMIRHGSKAEGKYVELQNLKIGMSLMPFYKKEKNGYWHINLNNRKSIGEHTLIGIDVFKKEVGKDSGNVMHHKDENRLNNDLRNLEIMSISDHVSLHHKGKRRRPLSKEHKEKISKAIKGVSCPQRGNKQTDEQKRALSIRMSGRTLPKSQVKKLSDSKKEYWKNKKVDQECKVCGKMFKNVTNTHLKSAHDMTLAEYKREYNHKIVSIEFHGHEDVYNINVKGAHNFAVSAGVIIKNSYHMDKTFIHDITLGDMHRDLAIEIFMASFDMMDKNNSKYSKAQKKKIKELRFFTKNNWTFAQFYGDWFGSCAPKLWEIVVEGGLEFPNGVSVKDHLESKGIYELGVMEKYEPSEGSFLEHCKNIEDKMWNERFPDYTQWKKDTIEFYQRYGFIETYFGFRFQGYMDRKQCTNYPIQGSSFHLLLFTLNEIAKFIRKNKLRTKLIGQVHDSVLSDIHKDETEFYVEGVSNIVSDLQNRFEWLVVPMEIETELSELKEDGGNFAEMAEMSMDQIKQL
ncbi:MAG: DNA polymerase [Candidatus Tenebribacter davisii]|nr:DNA polymerase [Candidatus Tenebribacter davisii]